MLIFWIILIAVISVIWAFISLKKERQRHEIDKAKEEISHGRVIYHSSSEGSSESDF